MEDGRYSSHDIADIHYIYGLCDGNANRTVREYARRYPNRQTPHARTFIRIHHRLAENAWSNAHIFGELLPLLPCLYLMQSREGQFDSSVSLPYSAICSRFLTGVRSTTVIQTDSASPS
nr:unnamed protein product [Callosobruchus chinensis]